MKKLLFATFLLLLSNSAFAKWYQVEMVVFENLSPDTGGELWNTGNAPDYRNTVELLTDATASSAFKVLPPSSYKLGGVDKVLKLSSEYRPVYHVAWQQQELTKSRAKAVHIKNTAAKINGSVNLRGGHLLHLDIDLTYFIDLYTESPVSFGQQDVTVEVAPEKSAPEKNPSEEVTGEDLVMSGTYAQMKETRRIKLNELHYFDHPLFGVIMRVTRLEVGE